MMSSKDINARLRMIDFLLDNGFNGHPLDQYKVDILLSEKEELEKELKIIVEVLLNESVLLSDEESNL